MARSDWFQLAFKFLGVYFLVGGIAHIGPSIQFIALTSSRELSFAGFGHVFSAAVQIGAGYLLIAKTGACLLKCGEIPSTPQG
jgi:hypothetical protein